jgi:mRNA interferase MazF
MPKPVKRGEIYFAEFTDTVGSEQRGHRPVLILSNDTGNIHSPTVVVAAITGRDKKPLPTHYLLPIGNGLDIQSHVLLEQLRTVDKVRLQNCIGRLDDETMKGVDRALAVNVGLAYEEET